MSCTMLKSGNTVLEIASLQEISGSRFGNLSEGERNAVGFSNTFRRSKAMMKRDAEGQIEPIQRSPRASDVFSSQPVLADRCVAYSAMQVLQPRHTSMRWRPVGLGPGAVPSP